MTRRANPDPLTVGALRRLLGAAPDDALVGLVLPPDTPREEFTVVLDVEATYTGGPMVRLAPARFETPAEHRGATGTVPIALGFSVASAEAIALSFDAGDLVLEFRDFRQQAIEHRFVDALAFRWAAVPSHPTTPREDSTYEVPSSPWLADELRAKGKSTQPPGSPGVLRGQGRSADRRPLSSRLSPRIAGIARAGPALRL